MRVEDYIYSEEYNQSAVKQAIFNGPYASSIFVDDSFMLYSGGIYKGDCSKKNTVINHAVVVVQITKEFIKIRNSWSSIWGEQGYMKVKRDLNNNYSCFLEQIVYQPTKVVKTNWK